MNIFIDPSSVLTSVLTLCPFVVEFGGVIQEVSVVRYSLFDNSTNLASKYYSTLSSINQ